MDLSKLNLQDMLDVAAETAKMAGKILIDGQSSAKARRKRDGSMVTDMDYKAEGLIIKTLWRKFSRYCFGFLCEEHGKINSQEYRWIVDPCDGTDSYVRGIPGWSVMIAFEA